MNQQVVYQDISQIHPYENNPRNNEAAVGPVAQSIKEFGFRVPILIDGKGTIIAGHTRYEAAKRLGMDKVPCILVDDLTDAQIKAYRIADNKVAEASSWNDDVLRAEMDALQALDVDLSSTGFSEVELDGLLRDVDDTVCNKAGCAGGIRPHKTGTCDEDPAERNPGSNMASGCCQMSFSNGSG